LPSERVIRSLDKIIEWRGAPKAIRCDNGPEYISAVTRAWAVKRDIRIDFIEPGNPQQNACVERYNRTVRDDWLAHHLFESIDEVQILPPVGYRLTIMTGPTWALAVLHQNKN
jgi:putative transposase